MNAVPVENRANATVRYVGVVSTIDEEARGALRENRSRHIAFDHPFPNILGRRERFALVIETQACEGDLIIQYEDKNDARGRQLHP